MTARDEEDAAAREAALRRFEVRWRVKDEDVRTWYRGGWNGAQDAPPLPWLYRSWGIWPARAHRAGRRAARAYRKAAQS